MPLGMEVGLGPDDTVLDGDPAPPMKRAQQPPPNFWPTSIVAKWSPISATVELVIIENFAMLLICGSLFCI